MAAVEPIAIVGIGCRFPGANGPDAFWRLLAGGVDAISEVPPDRWSLDEFYDEDPAAPGKMNTRWGGFIDGVDRFDASFFGVSPREAAHIDPQQRLLMEVAWEALEDAGLPAERLRGERVGVFVGTSSWDYGGLQFSRLHGIRDGYMNIGCNLSILANRLSYFFDFRGPSIVIDTACSSSLVAAYYACQSLERGESRVALAGGVNVILSPVVTIGFSKLQAMAPDGRCKAFDARANGFVRAEGAGLVVLKSLSSALEDGDRIYAVIRGGAVNQDGRTNGLTAPNGLSQDALLREAFSNSGVAPADIQFVEAHGTGTALGDPIELNALGAVLSAGRSREARCAVGSVKTNVGHLEAAAGVASLIKLALSIDRRQLPPSLHFETPNPYIRFDVLPLRVVTELEPWPSESDAILAGVSAFGFGGTNVHLVLEAPPHRTDEPRVEAGDCLLPISAKSEAALSSLARSYVERLEDAADDAALADLCATAAVRRTHHDFRLAIVAPSHAEMRSKLTAYLSGDAPRGVEAGRRMSSRRRKVAFVFPGHGSQWRGMGRELARVEPVFADALTRCADAISEHVDWSLIEELHASDERSRLDEVDVIQPAMFAIQVALSELWRSWGVTPDAVVGHSMGEVAAAHVVGALSLADAARVICHRGRLAKRASGRGAMAMVALPLDRASELVSGYDGRLGIAACNSPTSTVVSGDTDALDEVVARLESEGVFWRRVKIGYASHSPHMDELKDELLAASQGITARRTTIPFYSTVDGAPVPGTSLDPAYWVRNLREPVLFAAAIEKMARAGMDVFLEISPHPILLSSIRECAAHEQRDVLTLASLRREENERRALLTTVASLYAIGKPIAWSGVYSRGACHVSLPTYPWQRERFWFDDGGRETSQHRPARKARNPLIGDHIQLASVPGTHVWESEIDAYGSPPLNDRKVDGNVEVPVSGYLEMAFEAGREALGSGVAFELENVTIESRLVLAENESFKVQVVLTERAASRFDWQILAAPVEREGGVAREFSLLARGEIKVASGASPASGANADLFEMVEARCTTERTGPDHYRRLSDLTLEYGPLLRHIESVRIGDGEAIGTLKPSPSDAKRYQIHPAVLEGALQLLLDGVGTASGAKPEVVSLQRVRLLAPLTPARWVHATWKIDGAIATADLRLVANDESTVAEICGLRLKLGDASGRDLDGCFYTLEWERKAHFGAHAVEGCILIFDDATGVGSGLAERIAAEGGHPIRVVAGQALSIPDDPFEERAWVVRPRNGDDYLRVLQTLAGRSRTPSAIVHLWTLDVIDESEDAAAVACFSAVLLVQALARAAIEQPPRLWLVTSNAQQVVEGDRVAPFRAPMWGLARTIAQEHPELFCSVIDLEHGTQPDIEGVLDELREQSNEQQIAIRHEGRFVARLTRGHSACDRTAASVARPIEAAVRIRDDATYVLTGGLGGLALLTARWLVEHGARCLVLLGRRQPGAAARDAIEAMERAGARIHLDRLDVSDHFAVDRAFARWERDLPPIRGILHLAGVLDDAITLQQTRERFDAVLTPKVAGTWNLHHGSLGLQLDFFILFSSAASLLGSAGQPNYAAANQFLDAIAHYRRALKLPATSINWGPWAEVGLAAEAARAGRLRVAGIRQLSVVDGLNALDRILRLDVPQTAVMAIEWNAVREAHPVLAEQPFLSRVIEATPAASRIPQGAAADILALSPAERMSAIADRLRDHAASVLRLPAARIDLEESLLAMGVDSLMAVDLKERIERELGVSVPLVQLIKAPSLSELASMVAARLSNTSYESAAAPADGGKSLLVSLLSLKDGAHR
jgi:acyl transferase domain-containing protein